MAQAVIGNHAAGDQTPPPLALLELLNGMWVARAVQLAAELGLPDLLARGPRTVSELADATGSDPDALWRLLRALETVGIFSETEPRLYSQTPRSACLCSDHPASMRDAARMFGAEWQWHSWAAFGHSIETGRPAFDRVHGMGLLDYLDTCPDAATLFDGAMLDMSAFLNRAVIRASDFGDVQSVIDVGGAHSMLLADIARAHPALAGTVVDRPGAAERLRRRLETAGLAERVRVIAGDFSTEIPSGADVYLLNRVLHDWDDERALAILRACRAAMSPGSRLLIIEQMLEPGVPNKRAAFLDLQMLQQRGGRERSSTEFAALLERASLQTRELVPTFSPMTIVVAERRESADTQFPRVHTPDQGVSQ